MNQTRRDILKGLSLGAGSLLLPLADQLHAQSSGTVGKTQRFVFVVKSSGMTPAAVVPESFAAELTTQGKAIDAGDTYVSGNKLNKATKLIDKSLKDAKLHKTMAALEPFKDRLSIIQGLSGQMVNGGHMSGYGAMSCVKGNGNGNNPGTPTAETIDSMMARAFPSVFNHLGLSLVTGTMTAPGVPPATSVCYPGISAAGPGKAVPFHGDPFQAHGSLFGSVSSGAAKAQFNLSSKVFDTMAADVKNLMKTVGAAERQKLEFHLDAIEDMDRRRAMIAKMGPQIEKGMPPISERYKSMVCIDRLACHFDIAAGALISGLTNAVTIRMDGLSTLYTGLGINDLNVHGIGHGGTPQGFESPDHATDKIREYHLQQVAKLAAALDKVPEGDGTMLDNTTIVYFSDVGDKHHAANLEWPFVVVGNAGGKLNTQGRYVQYPAKGNAGHHTIANWWMTLLHAIGKPTDEFGMKDARIPAVAQKGPLVELLA